MDIKKMVEEQITKAIADAVQSAMGALVSDTTPKAIANVDTGSESMVERLRETHAGVVSASARRRFMPRTIGYALKRITKGAHKGDAVLPGIDVPDRVKPVLEALVAAAAKNPTAKRIVWKPLAETKPLTIADLMRETGRTSKRIENDVYWLRVQGVVDRHSLVSE